MASTKTSQQALSIDMHIKKHYEKIYKRLMFIFIFCSKLTWFYAVPQLTRKKRSTHQRTCPPFCTLPLINTFCYAQQLAPAVIGKA